MPVSVESSSSKTSVKIVVYSDASHYAMYNRQQAPFKKEFRVKSYSPALLSHRCIAFNCDIPDPPFHILCDRNRLLSRTRTHPFFFIFIASDVPASAAYFGSYEIIQRSLVPEGGSRSDLSISTTIFAGGMAGIFNWIVGIPPDVMKSRLQTGTIIDRGSQFMLASLHRKCNRNINVISYTITM